MHNRQGLSIFNIWTALSDWTMWPLYIIGLTHFSTWPVVFQFVIALTPLYSSYWSVVPKLIFDKIITLNMSCEGPPQTYLTLILRQLKFTTIQTNLLTIPSVVIGGIGLVATAYLSERINSRVFSTITLQVWALPLLIALSTFTQHTSRWAYYAVVTLIAGYPYVHPIQVAWASRNSYSVRSRTVSASVYNMFVQAGNIVYSQIYRADDAVRAPYSSFTCRTVLISVLCSHRTSAETIF
jgi:hypothetical protein